MSPHPPPHKALPCAHNAEHNLLSAISSATTSNCANILSLPAAQDLSSGLVGPAAGPPRGVLVRPPGVVLCSASRSDLLVTCRPTVSGGSPGCPGSLGTVFYVLPSLSFSHLLVLPYRVSPCLVNLLFPCAPLLLCQFIMLPSVPLFHYFLCSSGHYLPGLWSFSVFSLYWLLDFSPVVSFSSIIEQFVVHPFYQHKP